MMKIQKVILTNYRGARSLAIDFSARLNVFYGVNGAGKSTLLDAITIMLTWAVSRLRHTAGSGRPISENDISNGKSFALLEIACIVQNQVVDWKLSKSRQGHGHPEDRSNLTKLNEFVRQLQGQIEASAENTNLPLLAYYPVNRAVLDIPLRIRERHQFHLLAAYDDALTSGANFRTFFEWFREREDLENENRKYANEQPSLFGGGTRDAGTAFPDPQLEAVRGALHQFLPEFSNLTVRRNPLRMEVDKCGERLTVNQLSDGEKCLIAMIGDLARRLAIANPLLENPLDGTGVVLIDEIDLHLHPKWQRIVVPGLIRVFPNCQFILSTHSPHVITHVHPNHLFLLKQGEEVGITAERPIESYGKTVDRVLEDLMGLETTRPATVFEGLNSLYVEINRGNLSGARQRVAELRAEVGDDPELVKAEILIKRKEIIGK